MDEKIIKDKIDNMTLEELKEEAFKMLFAREKTRIRVERTRKKKRGVKDGDK